MLAAAAGAIISLLFAGYVALGLLRDARASASVPLDRGQQLMIVGILAAAAVGVTMALQSTSLVRGTGLQWTGFAIALAGVIATVVLRASLPMWVSGVSLLAAVVALFSCVYLEKAVHDQQQELQHQLENF